MIDEKKLFEFIKEYSYPITQFSNSIDIGMTLAGIKQAIDEQPKIGEWIPCSERLPNVSRCMVTLKYDMEVDPPIYETEIVDFGRWRDGYGFRDDQMNDITCNVIAWQPLPEPYEGE